MGTDNFQSPSLATQHLIYLPEGYSGSREWPLVVFLHGSGERGTDLTRLRSAKILFLKFPAIVLVPQCLPDSGWQPAVVLSLIQHLTERYRVDSRRVYLVGYSMGGFSVVATAAAYPKEFAAIVPIAGGGGSDDAKNLRDIPLWAFHGGNDQVVPVTESERMVDAIKNAGGNAKLTILPNAEHGICDDVLGREELWQWLFAQKRPSE